MIWNQHLLYQIIDVWYHIRKLYLINNEKNDKIKLYHFFYKRRPIHTQLKFLTELIHSKDIVDIARKSSDFSFRFLQTLSTREALQPNSFFYSKSVPLLSFSTCLPYALQTHYFSLSKENMTLVTSPPSIKCSTTFFAKCQKKKGKKQ